MSHVIGVITGAAVALVLNETSGYLEWIVLAAAAVTGLGILRRNVLKPVLAFAGRVDATLEDLRGLPKMSDRIAGVEAEVHGLGVAQTRHDGRLQSIENSLGSMASTERLSVKRLMQVD